MKFCCPTCKMTYDEDEICAFRKDGKWVPMCPGCQEYDEIQPLGVSGWYLTVTGPALLFLGTDEEVYRRLVAGETLGPDKPLGQDSNRRVSMHDIILEEIEFGNTPPRFSEKDDKDFYWGEAWLDGKLSNYTPAQYLRELMDDRDCREYGLLGGCLVYLDNPDVEEGAK